VSASDWIAILIGIATLVVVIGGALIKHIVNDAHEQGSMKTEIRQLKDQIGGSETGLIGSLHKQKNAVGRLQALMYFIADKIGISVKKDDE
jgi:hypothetical protein